MDIAEWAQTMINTLNAHMDNEREALREYKGLSEGSSQEAVRYLARIILEDEIRHHGLFADMVERLRSEISQLDDGSLPPLHPTDDEQLRAKTAELIRLERDDLKELKSLRRDVTKVADTAWWSVIVDIMELDTRKHITILEFIRDHV